MNAEVLFSILNTAVLPVWMLMIFAPKWKVTLAIINSYALPLIICAVYAVIIFSTLGSINFEDFGSLSGVIHMFSSGDEWGISAAWFHYLAFDMLIGTWILMDAQKEGIKHLYVGPCLIFTFMLGPVGFLLYQFIKMVKIKG